jgi:hypothetical protein
VFKFLLLVEEDLGMVNLVVQVDMQKHMLTFHQYLQLV